MCYGAELSRIGRHEEARDWLISVLQVYREFKVPRMRDVSVKLLIKIAKSEKEMQDDHWSLTRTRTRRRLT